jgi:hypothetical protein
VKISNRPRQFNLATLLICFAFLAIRISGVHAHRFVALPAADETTIVQVIFSHVELGLFHLDTAQSDDHDHYHDASTKTAEHADLKLDEWPDAFVKLSPLSQAQVSILAQVMLWQIEPSPPSAIPRHGPPRAGPQRPRLRPPSCGPPSTFSV